MSNLADLPDNSCAIDNRNLTSPLGGIFKRGFDIIGASAGLIFLSPLLLLIAALVKYSDGGNIFYGHRRVGFRGRMFQCLKFQTMAENGDRILVDYFKRNPEARLEWEATRKLKNDPRVTAVGDVLRRLSLDELPQLFNVLIGDMSLVGPRPVVEDELIRYGDAMNCYINLRPGLTGLWQVNGRSDVSYETRIAFDRRYAETWSFFQDMFIIFKTVPAVLSLSGSR